MSFVELHLKFRRALFRMALPNVSDNFRGAIFIFRVSTRIVGMPPSLLNVPHHMTGLSDFSIGYMSKWSDWKPVHRQNRTKSYCLYRYRHCESSNQTWCDEKTIEIKNCTG